MNAQYDIISDLYDKYWKDIILGNYSVFERTLLPSLPKGSRILDVCCGTGQIASLLSERNYVVDGLDISEKMIEKAKATAPKASFKVADATNFSYDVSFDAAICTLDSLNHITNPIDLEKVLVNILNVLKPEGILCFDVRNEEGYKYNWDKHNASIIEKEFVLTYQTIYSAYDQLGIMKGTYFKYLDKWERNDFSIVQRCYSEEEFSTLLTKVGFSDIEIFKTKENVDMNILGRSHFKCVKRV